MAKNGKVVAKEEPKKEAPKKDVQPDVIPTIKANKGDVLNGVKAVGN